MSRSRHAPVSWAVNLFEARQRSYWVAAPAHLPRCLAAASNTCNPAAADRLRHALIGAALTSQPRAAAGIAATRGVGTC
jgi:hypothetical protein